MYYAFFRILLIDEGGDALVSALVGINLTHDIERVSAFFSRGFGDGIVNFRLAAVEALNGHGVIRFQLNSLIFRQFNNAVNHAVFLFICFWGILFVQRNRHALVAAVALIGLVNNVKRGSAVFIGGF
ncbi:Uncharacterised protein [Enterobacter cloacae]|nr:Uncharacterised protein [Enterobacter cloacae]